MEHWLAIRDLLADALEQPERQRLNYLHTAGASLPPEALTEAERYLAAASDAEARPDNKLSAPVAELVRAVTAERDPPTLPERIGLWRRRELLGEGGMGSVYRAERADGTFEREVALKLVRASDALGRHEVAALARLEHPHIARLYDAGVLSLGRERRWYFVMERIVGRTLAAASRDAPLATRVGWLAAVAAALAYANGRGVQHGDLKADNVLVDERGSVRLIDFGIAGLMAERHGGSSGGGGGGGANALNGVSDAEAFGRLLRNLCPETVGEPGLAAVARAAANGTYAGTRAIADDLERWRAGRSPGTLRGAGIYRARRWLKRHRAGIAIASAVALAVLVGLGMRWRARKAEATAAQRATAISSTAGAMIDEVHDALNGLDGDVGARERVLSEAIGLLEAVGRRDLGPAAKLRLGSAYYKLGYVQGIQGNPSRGDVTAASRSFRSGAAVLRGEPAFVDGPDTLRLAYAITRARLLEKLGVTIAQRDSLAAGIAHIDSAGAVLAKAYRAWPEDGDVATYYTGALINLGDYTGHPYFPNTGDPAAAAVLYHRARDVVRAVRPARRTLYTDRLEALTSERLGALHRLAGEYDEARLAFGAAAAFQRALIDGGRANRATYRDLANARASLGTLEVDAGRATAALPYLRQAETYFRERVRADTADLGARMDLGYALIHLGDGMRALGRDAAADAAYGEADDWVRPVAEADAAAVRPREALAEIARKRTAD